MVPPSRLVRLKTQPRDTFTGLPPKNHFTKTSAQHSRQHYSNSQYAEQLPYRLKTARNGTIEWGHTLQEDLNSLNVPIFYSPEELGNRYRDIEQERLKISKGRLTDKDREELKHAKSAVERLRVLYSELSQQQRRDLRNYRESMMADRPEGWTTNQRDIGLRKSETHRKSGGHKTSGGHRKSGQRKQANRRPRETSGCLCVVM